MAKLQAFELAIAAVTVSQLRFFLHATLTFCTQPHKCARWNDSVEFVPWQMGADGPFSILVTLLAALAFINGNSAAIWQDSAEL